MSGFYNVHSHAPMTLLRGYAENLPLQRWLGEKVFPFEDKIDDEAAYYGTQLSIAEIDVYKRQVCISISTVIPTSTPRIQATMLCTTLRAKS